MSEMPLTVTQQADKLRNIYNSRPAGFFKAVRKLYLPLQEGKATEKTFFDYTLVIFEETENLKANLILLHQAVPVTGTALKVW